MRAAKKEASGLKQLFELVRKCVPHDVYESITLELHKVSSKPNRDKARYLMGQLIA
jgi:hypothetical protein